MNRKQDADFEKVLLGLTDTGIEVTYFSFGPESFQVRLLPGSDPTAIRCREIL